MRVLNRLRRLVAAAVALTTAVGLPAAAQKTDISGKGSVVLMAAIEGPIGPATVRHVGRAIGLAEERGAPALVLRLNTPGGLADSMREIISQVLASPVPVIGYVAPAGAHAASAGTYILYATHVAAMAPATNLGAATPVQLGGSPDTVPGGDGDKNDRPAGDRSPDKGGSGRNTDLMGSEQAMSAKMTNDSVALIRSLARLRGRNADWAERAVREAASLPATEALEMDVIDVVARDVDELLDAADGRMVEIGRTSHKLTVAGLPVERIDMTTTTQILSLLSNPNVALILMMIGVYGLIFEFWNPGSVGPGVIGAISLTLGLYALNMLPFSYAGLALIGLGVAFMVVEALTPTVGVVGIGGLVAFIIGASMLVDTDAPGFQISWWLIGTLAVISGAVLVLVLGAALRSYRHKPVSGQARMIGAPADVLEWQGSEGYVWAEGERWHAAGAEDLCAGQTVQVRNVNGLTLVVNADHDAQPEREH
ncbi:NfeD family protein [Roseibium salinum]|uniref:Nodulation protein NfeD n=1 Tax=Roseibium salinum TaxID=1604349 RepID=A0ABT3R8U0_9HYPH|nr:nodulation protein NfeD [Roseibium sp. DSM 29163]MCX2725727.1 nodulation protein NfeD [Roseibium sp. DSM 29163]